MAKRYYPKRDRHFGKYTQGKQWATMDGKEYNGPYHYFANFELVMTGAFPRDDSQVLKRYRPSDLTNQGNKDIFTYDLLTILNLYEFETPIAKTPGPGPNDIANGYMMRYFIKAKNDPEAPVIEIDLKQYKKVKKADSKNINGFLYEKLSLRWKIAGPLYDQFDDKKRTKVKAYGIQDTNRRTVFSKNQKMAGLSVYLGDLTQHSYFSTMTKSKKPGVQKDNLYTDGSDFVLPNGSAYIGYYHIHPHKGAMRGKRHNKEAHDALQTPSEWKYAKAKEASGGGGGGSNSSGY